MTLPELQAMADMTAKYMGLVARPVLSIIDKGDCALAYYTDNRIEIPRHVLAREYSLQVYVVGHEVCHFLGKDYLKHGKKFRAAEKKALAFWGYCPIRKHANNNFPFKCVKL